jgi:hypothetical protein
VITCHFHINPVLSCDLQGVKAVKEEIDESSAYSRGRLYKPPGSMLEAY